MGLPSSILRRIIRRQTGITITVLSERALREIYLKGFEICVHLAQPKALMTSYNLLNGVHTSERKDLLGDVLRSEFGFKGIVMTDWVTSSDIERWCKISGT